ncbi:tumor necrosis factor receptor superfamily member 4 [Anolis carolinensis]|uniref:tumor necrosis factor receptor superfamily member 4 n=1 Tax=Anolis carolinensis TaxID=28377 RepID=UPI002F2B6569
MKPTLRLLGFAWLVPITWGLRCSDGEYSLEDRKCCKKCPPGSGLEKRCTAYADTDCKPCEENSYNDMYTYSRCKRCTFCEKERGLQEEKPCDKYSNARCACLPGYEEEVRTEEKRCDPCRDGFFSKGGTDKCRPWRNGTAEGKKTLSSGRREEGSISEDQSSTPERSTTISLSFRPVPEKVRPTTRSIPDSLTTRLNEHKPVGSDPVFVSFFVVGVVLFLAAGGSALWLFRRKSRKRHQELEGLYGPLRERGKGSYRIPIQEEQTDSKSSLG